MQYHFLLAQNVSAVRCYTGPYIRLVYGSIIIEIVIKLMVMVSEFRLHYIPIGREGRDIIC